ncbi:hypothetical protein O3G_MSEX011336 [Manduca sexta]|uniref:RRM domain-containing protein n=1 Tax=Manduca sexta TaxID=7130 RepID=A0A922CV00_MANSE|nr:hypothetical protein O3G_MSEX011336 [Manduca sexta]
MRRKSERSSSRKSTSKTSPEKKIEKVKRPKTRRKKQSTSSENESLDEASPVQEPVVVDSDIKPPSTPVKEDSPEEAPDHVWRVKATESADSGEIQKLKICLTRPPSTPERADRSPRSKRKHSRATSSSDATSGEGVDEKRKTKHRSRRGHHDSKDESEKTQDSHGEEQEAENEAQQSKEAQENESEVTQSDKAQSQITESAISTTNEETSNTATEECGQANEENNTVTETECRSDADTTVASPKSEMADSSKQTSAPTADNEGSVTDTQDNLGEKQESTFEKQDDTVVESEKQKHLDEQPIQTEGSNLIEKQDTAIEEHGDSKNSVSEAEKKDELMENKNILDEKFENAAESQSDIQTSIQGFSVDKSESHDESEIIELHPDDSKIETSDIEMSKVSEQESMEEPKHDEDQQVRVSISRERAVSNEKETEKKEKTKDNNESGVVENENDERDLRKPSTDSEHDKDTEKSEVHKQPLEIERQNSTETPHLDTTPTVCEDVAQNGPAPTVVNRKRRWGSRHTKLTTQKSITISTDVLKEIIPDVKPVEFDEVIEEKKHRRVEVPEKIERPVLPKIIIDNTESVDHNRKEIEPDQKDKENIKSRESHLAANRKISIIQDNDSILARPPSPPKHKQSSILYITNLVRPFTLPQLKNLLQRTGRIVENGFWIDRIKSKCFVQYETEDQAVETRHALHGVKWPVSNPKTLQVDFSTPDAFDKAKSNEDADNAQTSTIPGTVEDWLREQDQKRERGEVVNEKPWERKAAMREWDVGKNEKNEKEREKVRREERPPEKRRHRSQERSPEPARKFKKKEEEAPAKLLDDLFRKTKTTPCIYWLPLSAETIAIKEEQRRQHMAEYERRMQEQRRPHRRH